MAYGQIVLANTKSGFNHQLLRFFMGVNLTHSLVTVPDLAGLPMCMEAASNGVDATRFDTSYLQNARVQIEIWEVNISDEVKDAGIQAVINKLEVNYGYLELPWFAWRWLNKLFGKDIKNQNNWSQNGEICSQLVQVYLTGCGLEQLFERYGNCAVHPGDLRNIMQANPKYFTKVFSNF